MPETQILQLAITYATPSVAVIVFAHWVLRPLVHQYVNERMGTQRISNGVASNKELQSLADTLKEQVETLQGQTGELDTQLNNHTATDIREIKDILTKIEVRMGVLEYKVESQDKAIELLKQV